MNIVKISEQLKDHNVSLRVNENSSEAIYDILHLQCSGNIEYSGDTGFKCKDTNHIDLLRKFIELALSFNSALVITPECSFPFIVLGEIIEEKSLWPALKNIWSLGMEGISVSSFKDLIYKLQLLSDIKIIFDDNNVTYKRHCNTVWNLFRINNNTLCIVIQFKQRHALDRNIDYEADALSVGDTTYIFDLNNKTPTKNILLSVICSDAISLSSSELLDSIKHTHPLIINPQLNNQPFDERFKSFRNTVFSDSNIYARMITLNWCKDTRINNKNFVIESGSAFFDYLSANGKSYLEAICKDSDLFSHRRTNLKKGFIYFAEKKYNIWLMDDTCNCARYFIKKGEIFGTDRTLDNSFEPNAKNLLKFDVPNKSFIEIQSHFCTDSWKDELAQQGANPLYLNECINRKCNDKCLWLYNDYFFGICFGNFCKSELESFFEISNRTLYSLSSDSQKNTDRKRELFSKLIKCLNDNKFPECFNILCDNYLFDMDNNYAESGSNNIFNLRVKNTNGQDTWKFKKFLVVICDTTKISEVQVLYDILKAKTNMNIKDQILIYYRYDNDYILYDEPLIQNGIGVGSASYTKDIQKASV